MKVQAKAEHASPVRFAVLASDVALFTVRDGNLLVRVIDVNRPPYFVRIPGLPGGLIGVEETAEESAHRHLSHKAGVEDAKLYIEQFHTFSDVRRDPRNRVVAVGHIGLVAWDNLTKEEQADSSEGARWRSVAGLRGLAYDHDQILEKATEHLRSRVRATTIASKLMPKEFTLTELEVVYESILKTDLDKRNFRKKILALEVVQEVPNKKRGGKFRPAQLYSFTSRKIEPTS